MNDGHTEYTPGISQSSASGQLYYTQDRMGSDVQQENALGGVTFSGQLDAFGNSITHTGDAVGLFGFAGSHGYQGDADIYCYLCGNREYDPSIGRFLTRDPAQDGENWYDYCSNNPLSYVDPSGYGHRSKRNGKKNKGKHEKGTTRQMLDQKRAAKHREESQQKAKNRKKKFEQAEKLRAKEKYIQFLKRVIARQAAKEIAERGAAAIFEFLGDACVATEAGCAVFGE